MAALHHLVDRELGGATTSMRNLADFCVLSVGCGFGLAKGDVNSALAHESVADWMAGQHSVIDIMRVTADSIAHVNVQDLFNALACGDQYLRVQIGGDSSTSAPTQPGYVLPEVVSALESLDDATDRTTDLLVRIGKALAECYRPLVRDFVRAYLVTGDGVGNAADRMADDGSKFFA